MSCGSRGHRGATAAPALLLPGLASVSVKSEDRQPHEKAPVGGRDPHAWRLVRGRCPRHRALPQPRAEKPAKPPRKGRARTSPKGTGGGKWLSPRRCPPPRQQQQTGEDSLRGGGRGPAPGGGERGQPREQGGVSRKVGGGSWAQRSRFQERVWRRWSQCLEETTPTFTAEPGQRPPEGCRDRAELDGLSLSQKGGPGGSGPGGSGPRESHRDRVVGPHAVGTTGTDHSEAGGRCGEEGATEWVNRSKAQTSSCEKAQAHTGRGGGGD